MTASPLQPFLDLREHVIAERIGDGGVEVCRPLTEVLDRGIADLAADMPEGLAVFALGGYGRGELNIFSDVDVLVLHDGADPEVAVRAVLYPLWDANLKVGHAVRDLRETAASGREDFETLTSLLSFRFLAGDRQLVEPLTVEVRDLVRGRPLGWKLAQLERERRVRDPYPIMTADLKDGRGALRTHQGLWWERRRATLLDLPNDAPSEPEMEAHHTLIAVRNALHASARRANDRFVVGLREPAAAWLGTDIYGVASMVTSALDVGDRIADRRWPDIHVETDPMVRFGRQIFGAIRSRFSTDVSDPPTGALALAVEAAGREGGARLSDEEEVAIATAPPAPWTAADRTSFERLLSAGARGRSIFGQLDTLGWMDREFPEWRAVSTAPQIAPFHDHPVGAHLHRTVAEMITLIEDRGDLGMIADEVSSTEDLILAAFFHDIGKARGGDHANVGAILAASFLRRTGFGPSTVATVTDAVRLHLLLPETATRRDIADPAVVSEVAEAIGTRRQLQILYLLSIADLKATGTTMWNTWRDSLLRTLYDRTLSALDAGDAPPATVDIAGIMAVADDGVDRRGIEEHVAAMPSDYLATTPPGDVLWHLRSLEALGDDAQILVDPSQGTRVLVIGPDRSGFLLAVSRAFAASGVAVLDARLRTRSDGVAVDTFHAVDDRTGDPVPSEKWVAIEHDVKDALAGRRDLRPTVRERVATYRRTDRTGSIRIRAAVDGRFTTIDVRMPDDVGVFTSIVEALHGEGLDIHLARIDTMAEDARDVFFVRRVGGGSIRTAPELQALENRLIDRLRN